jgi:hypothetical protein
LEDDIKMSPPLKALIVMMLDGVNDDDDAR